MPASYLHDTYYKGHSTRDVNLRPETLPTAYRVTRLGGLAIALILPALISPWQSQPPEPIKVVFFQVIVLFMLILRCWPWFQSCRQSGFVLCAGRIRDWVGLGGRYHTSPLRLIILGYGCAYLVASCFSIDPRLSLWISRDTVRGTISVMGLLAFFLLMLPFFHSQQNRNELTAALLIGSVPIAIYGLVQYASLDPLQWESDSVSPILSTLGRSNFLGAYLAILIPLTLHWLMTTGVRKQAWGTVVVLLIQVACLSFTLARGAWFAAIGGCLVYFGFMVNITRRRLVAVFLIVALLVGIGLAESTITRIASPERIFNLPTLVFLRARSDSARARLIIWRSTLELASERWLLGYGPATFAPVFMSHYPSGLVDEQLPPTLVNDPHNLILNRLMSAGAIGLLLFLAIISRFWVETLKALRRIHSRHSRSFLAATLGSVTAFLIQAQFNPEVMVTSMLFWLILAMGFAACHDQQAC